MITIERNDFAEIMRVTFKNKVIFNGNYWDFPRDPEEVFEFLKKLNLKVELKNYEIRT